MREAIVIVLMEERDKREERDCGGCGLWMGRVLGEGEEERKTLLSS
jgi:hypothetical protein